MADRTDGGCWFCGKVDKFLIYEEEFDTYVHVDCIRKALEDGEKTGGKATEANSLARRNGSSCIVQVHFSFSPLYFADALFRPSTACTSMVRVPDEVGSSLGSGVSSATVSRGLQAKL